MKNEELRMKNGSMKPEEMKNEELRIESPDRRVCMRTVSRRWRSEILFHFTHRCRGGLTTSAAPRLDFGGSTDKPQTELSHNHKLNSHADSEVRAVAFLILNS
jgi:hypothetical protein